MAGRMIGLSSAKPEQIYEIGSKPSLKSWHQSPRNQQHVRNKGFLAVHDFRWQRDHQQRAKQQASGKDAHSDLRAVEMIHDHAHQ